MAKCKLFNKLPLFHITSTGLNNLLYIHTDKTKSSRGTQTDLLDPNWVNAGKCKSPSVPAASPKAQHTPTSRFPFQSLWQLEKGKQKPLNCQICFHLAGRVCVCANVHGVPLSGRVRRKGCHRVPCRGTWGPT